jgi:hypothetical protein
VGFANCSRQSREELDTLTMTLECVKGGRERPERSKWPRGAFVARVTLGERWDWGSLVFSSQQDQRRAGSASGLAAEIAAFTHWRRIGPFQLDGGKS